MLFRSVDAFDGLPKAVSLSHFLWMLNRPELTFLSQSNSSTGDRDDEPLVEDSFR